jgi:NADH-quinone oxidoreductase subunit C
MMDEVIQVDPLEDLGQHIATTLGGAVLESSVAYGELTLTVDRLQSIVSVATFLRDDPRCRFIRSSTYLWRRLSGT